MAQIGDDGSVEFVEMPNVRQLDELSKSLSALSRNARNTEGMVPVDTPQSLRYQRQAQDLRQAIIDATGGDESPYRAAVRLGGDTIRERNAYELGERLLRPQTRLEDIRLELGPNPSQAQLDAAKSGLRTRIDEVVGNVRRIPSDPNIDARQAIATLRELGSDAARAKISRLMGDEANELFQLLDEAMIAAETRAAVSANSRTAIRGATQQDVADITTPGLLGQVMQGDPVNVTKALVQSVTGYTDELTARQRQQVYQDIARALTESRGENAQEALRLLSRAMEGQRLTDQQSDMIARAITGSIAAGATPFTGREVSTRLDR